MAQNIIKTRVVGVEISINRTAIAIIDVRGIILARDMFVTSDYPELNNYVSFLCERILKLVEENGGYETIRSVGISAPSSNFLSGCMENSPNMPWKGVVPLAAMIRDRLGLAVAIDNDANIRALGEQTFGVAHGMKDFIVISLGHGVGAAIFSKGRLCLGSDGYSGEFGHICVEPDGRECGCGRLGCVEAYCGANGIVATARELMAESSEPSLMRNEEDLTPKRIFEFCEQGDKMSQEVFRRTGYVLGRALANFAGLFNPEAIILSGGIHLAGKWLLEPTEEAFNKYVFHNIRDKVKLLSSNIDTSECDLLGAGALAWEVKEYSLFK